MYIPYYFSSGVDTSETCGIIIDKLGLSVDDKVFSATPVIKLSKVVVVLTSAWPTSAGWTHSLRSCGT